MTEYVSDHYWRTNKWSYEKFKKRRKKLTWDWDSISEQERKEQLAQMLVLAPPERYDYSTGSEPVPMDADFSDK